MVADWAKVAWERSSSTARRSPRDEIERTQPNIFSADETADVGVDEATPVTEDYKEGDNEFTGKIKKVVVEQKVEEPKAK